jgi:hypothetical protein
VRQWAKVTHQVGEQEEKGAAKQAASHTNTCRLPNGSPPDKGP